MYKDCEKDYIDTVRKATKNNDFTKLESINLGRHRMSGTLKSMALDNRYIKP